MTSTARRVVVYGAGGHAKVVAYVVTCLGHEVIGLVDDLLPAGTVRGGLSVMGSGAWLHGRSEEVAVALGIGDNRIRNETFQTCRRLSIPCPSFVHPHATVAPSARLADGCIVMAGAIINPDAEIEAGAIINTAAVVEHDCRVGAFAHVSPNATLAGGVRVGAFAHVGAGASVIPGVEVGADTIVGAGAVVTKPVPARVVAVGVPARVIRERP